MEYQAEGKQEILFVPFVMLNTLTAYSLYSNTQLLTSLSYCNATCQFCRFVSLCFTPLQKQNHWSRKSEICFVLVRVVCVQDDHVMCGPVHHEDIVCYFNILLSNKSVSHNS